MQFVSVEDTHGVTRRIYVGRIPVKDEQIIIRVGNNFALFVVNNVRHMGDYMDSGPSAETAIVYATFLHFLGKGW